MAYPSTLLTAGVPHKDYPWLAVAPLYNESRSLITTGRWQKLPAEWEHITIPDPECENCPALFHPQENPTGHKCVVQGLYVGGESLQPFTSGNDPYSRQQMIEFYNEFASRLSYLNWISVGMFSEKYILNGENTINFQENFRIAVSSASSTVLYCTTQEIDPQKMRLPEGSLFSMMPGMTVWFWETHLSAQIIKIDYSGIANGNFKIYLTHDIGVSSRSPNVVIVKGEIGAPERFTYPAPNTSMACVKKTVTIAIEDLNPIVGGEFDGWEELKDNSGNSCRIAFPKLEDEFDETFEVIEIMDNNDQVDITSTFVSGSGPIVSTVALTNTKTVYKTYILLEPGGNTAAYRIKYFPEASTLQLEIGFSGSSQVSCKNCMVDYSDSLGSHPHDATDTDGTYSYYCSKMRETNPVPLLENFRKECYQTNCPHFQIEDSAFIFNAHEIGKLWCSSNTYVKQLTPGVSIPAASSYVIGRGSNGLPSIGFLTGMRVYGQEGLYVQQCVWFGIRRFDKKRNGIWAEIPIRENFGGIWARAEFRFPGPHPSFSPTFGVVGGNNRIPYQGGDKPLIYGEADHTTNTDAYWNNTSDPWKTKRSHGLERLNASYMGSGPTPESSISSIGNQYFQSPKKTTRVFPKIAKTTSGSNIPNDTYEFGSFSIGGQNYGLKLHINAYGIERSFPQKAMLGNQIWTHSITNEILKIEFLPSKETNWFSPGYPRTVAVDNYVCCGNAVEAPVWRRPDNPGCSAKRKSFGDIGSSYGIEAGDTISILGVGFDGVRLQVLKADAFVGTEFVSPISIINTYVMGTPEGFWQGPEAEFDEDLDLLELVEEIGEIGEQEISTIVKVGYTVGFFTFEFYNGPSSATPGSKILLINSTDSKYNPAATTGAFQTQLSNVYPSIDVIDRIKTEYASNPYVLMLSGQVNFMEEQEVGEGEDPVFLEVIQSFRLFPEHVGLSGNYDSMPFIAIIRTPKESANNEISRYNVASGEWDENALILDDGPSTWYTTDPFEDITPGHAMMCLYDGVWTLLFSHADLGHEYRFTYDLENGTTLDPGDPPAGPGLPDDFESFRMKADRIYVDVSGILLTDVRDAMVSMEGLAVTVTTEAAMKSDYYYAGVGPGIIWNPNYSVCRVRIANYQEEGTWLVAGTDYDYDTASGLIYIQQSIIDALGSDICVSVEAWVMDRSDRFDPAYAIYSTKLAIDNLTTIRTGPAIKGAQIAITGDVGIGFADVTIIYDKDSYPFFGHSFNLQDPREPPPTPEKIIMFPSTHLAGEVGVSIQPVYDIVDSIVYHNNQILYTYNSNGPISRLSSSEIVSASIDMKSQSEEITSRTLTYDEDFEGEKIQYEYETGEATLSLMGIRYRIDEFGVYEVISMSAPGVPSTISTEWTTIDITDAVKELTSVNLGLDEKFGFIVSGVNGSVAPIGSDFDPLVRTFIEYYNQKYDENAEINILSSCRTTSYTGMNSMLFRNSTLTIRQTTNTPRRPYATYPQLID